MGSHAEHGNQKIGTRLSVDMLMRPSIGVIQVPEIMRDRMACWKFVLTGLSEVWVPTRSMGTRSRTKGPVFPDSSYSRSHAPRGNAYQFKRDVRGMSSHKEQGRAHQLASSNQHSID